MLGEAIKRYDMLNIVIRQVECRILDRSGSRYTGLHCSRCCGSSGVYRQYSWRCSELRPPILLMWGSARVQYLRIETGVRWSTPNRFQRYYFQTAPLFSALMMAAVIVRLFTLSPLRALVWVAALSAAFALWRVLVFRHLSALGPEGIRLRVRLPPEELNQLGFVRAFRRGATPRETMMVLTPQAVHFAAGKDYVSQIASDECEMSVEVDDRQRVNSVGFAFKERPFAFDRNAIGTLASGPGRSP